MNIIGQWKLKKMMSFDEDFNLILAPIEELIKKEPYNEQPFMVDAIYEFTPDGKMEMSVPVPDDAQDLCGDEECEIKNGRLILESKVWKEENGVYMVDSGGHREIFGEELSTWDKVEINGNIAKMYYAGEIACEIEKI